MQGSYRFREVRLLLLWFCVRLEEVGQDRVADRAYRFPEPLAFKGCGLCARELHVRSCCDAHSMSGAGQKRECQAPRRLASFTAAAPQ